jgi:small-conductance mechanosensitive channel
MAGASIPVLSYVVETMIFYAPKIVGAIIVLVVGWLLGRTISFLIGKIVEKMRLEAIFRRVFVGRAILRAGYTPSNFLSLLGKATIYFLSAMSALTLLSVPFITEIVQLLLEYLSNLVGGIIILLVGFIFADWISELVVRGSSLTLQSTILSGIVKFMLYFAVITIALTQMKIDVTIIYIFAQAFAWSIGIAIGIAFGWNIKDRVGAWLEKMMTDKDKVKDTV